MAQRTVRVDDLDGESEDARPVTFALEGVTYDIDLADENVQQLRKALSRYIDAARARTKPKQDARPRMDRDQLGAIRRWAHGQGYEFSDQGRIPNNIMEAWERFGPGAPKRGGGGGDKLFSG